MSFVRAIGLALLALPIGARAANPITLEEAQRLALERNPGVLSLQSDLAAARARLDGASLLLQSNPEISGAVGPKVASYGTSTDFSVALTQRIEIFGQRPARMDSARAQLESAEGRLASRKIEVAADVREGFARWLGARERERIANEALDVAQQSLSAAEARQRAGAASRIEVNAARAAVGRAVSERAGATRRLAVARASFMLVVGLEPSEPIEPRGTLSMGEPTPRDPLETMLETALSRRPDMRSARLAVDAAGADRRLASREALPSPRLGVSFNQQGDVDGPSRTTQGILAFDIPVFNQNQAAVGAASARVTQAEQALDALARSIRAEVALASTRLSTAETAARAYAGGLLAGLEENMQLAIEAYRAGKMDFFQLLVVRRETLEARNGYVDALEELEAAKAGLARAIGSLE